MCQITNFTMQLELLRMELLVRCVFRIFKPDDVAMSVIIGGQLMHRRDHSSVTTGTLSTGRARAPYICDVPFLEIIITVGHDSMS